MVLLDCQLRQWNRNANAGNDPLGGYIYHYIPRKRRSIIDAPPLGICSVRDIRWH
jgi:hypothetical protein